MNVVDSSAWLEFFADGPNARRFAPAIEDSANLAVPSICVAEVFRRMMRNVKPEVTASAEGWHDRVRQPILGRNFSDGDDALELVANG